MSDQTADRNQRLATAGLSAVGATAGAAGLGYAGHKLTGAYRAAPKALGVKGRLVRAASREKFGTALLPLEAAGLGGELMATKILHGDTKKQPVTKGLDMEFNGSSRTGRRIVEPSQTRANREAREAVSPEDMIAKARKREKARAGRLVTGGVFPGIHGLVAGKEGPGDHKIKAAGYELGGAVLGGTLVPGVGTIPGGAVGTHLAHEAGHYKRQKVRKSGAGVLRSMQALQRSSTKGRTALKEGLASQRKAQGAKTHGDFVALQQKVGKARRYDSEADRQRRIGYVGGGALGAGIVTGAKAKQHMHGELTRFEDVNGHPKQLLPKEKGKVAFRGLSFRTGRRGALYAAGTVGLGALSLGALKHGVSERNRTWT